MPPIIDRCYEVPEASELFAVTLEDPPGETAQTTLVKCRSPESALSIVSNFYGWPRAELAPCEPLEETGTFRAVERGQCAYPTLYLRATVTIHCHPWPFVYKVEVRGVRALEVPGE